MNFSTLSLLCLHWCGLCLLPCFFPLWKLTRGWQRSAKDPKSFVFHTVSRLSPHIPTHCVTLTYHEVPYDFRSDWPAECQDIRCLSLQGEYGELADLWDLPRKGKHTRWPFHWWSVGHGWVSTGVLALICRVHLEWNAWRCHKFIACSAAWVSSNKKNKKLYWWSLLVPSSVLLIL